MQSSGPSSLASGSGEAALPHTVAPQRAVHRCCGGWRTRARSQASTHARTNACRYALDCQGVPTNAPTNVPTYAPTNGPTSTPSYIDTDEYESWGHLQWHCPAGQFSHLATLLVQARACTGLTVAAIIRRRSAVLLQPWATAAALLATDRPMATLHPSHDDVYAQQAGTVCTAYSTQRHAVRCGGQYTH